MKINSPDEAKKFDDHLSRYLKKNNGRMLPYLPLDEIFHLAVALNDDRIFYSALDIKINLAYLDLDLQEATVVAGKALTELNGSESLFDEKAFSLRSEAHRYFSSYIFRYRAIWDKIFNFFILVFRPEYFSAFRNSKKGRKKKFLEIMKSKDGFNVSAIEGVLKDLNAFDESFRTPEVHDSGRIRKWTFVNGDKITPESFELLQYWNKLIRTLNMITEKCIRGKLE